MVAAEVSFFVHSKGTPSDSGYQFVSTVGVQFDGEYHYMSTLGTISCRQCAWMDELRNVELEEDRVARTQRSIFFYKIKKIIL